MDHLDQIRQKIDIVDLIGQHVTLKKAGRNFKALCPFHGEKTPSFVVSPERQIFKCFGCQKGGDIFGFLMELEGIDFGEAVRELAQRAGVELTSFRPSKEQEQKQRLYQINHLASEYYHYVLTQHQVGEQAREYLKNRGVSSGSIKIFHLGYAPDSWEGLLDWLVNKKGYRYQELEAAGLAIKGRGWYARFRGRIIFPLTDLRGQVVGFAGRVLDPQAKEAKYINSPETLLYHKSRHLFGLSITKEAVRKKNHAVLVEGELDAISSFQVGVKAVAAIKGSALTEDHVGLLKRFCDTLILALDADQAGDLAMRRSLEIVEAAGLNLKVVQLSGGKDPDELARHDPQAWKEAVKQAVSLYDFVINSAVKRFGSKTPEAKRKVTSEVLPWLARIQNEVVKAHFVKKLSRQLGVGETAVWQELEKQDKQVALGRQEPAESKTKPAKSRRENLEEYLLALIVQAHQWSQLIQEFNPDKVASFGIAKVLERLRQAPEAVAMIEFAKGLPQELQAVFDAAFLTELPELDADKQQTEVKRTVAELEKLQLHDRLTQLRGQMAGQKQVERQQTVQAIDQVLHQLQTLTHD
jgi:DNA primase